MEKDSSGCPLLFYLFYWQSAVNFHLVEIPPDRAAIQVSGWARPPLPMPHCLASLRYHGLDLRANLIHLVRRQRRGRQVTPGSFASLIRARRSVG